MQSATKFILIVSFSLLTSCFIGPVKEFKNQIEDSLQGEDTIVEPTKLIEITDKFNISTVWESSLGGNFLTNFEISICDKNIYLINEEGSIFSLDKANGQVLWNKKISNKISAGVSCTKSNIVIIGSDGYLYNLNSDGELLWKRYVGKVITKPLIIKTSIIIRTIDNNFLSINSTDGSKIWSYQSPSPPLTIKSWGKLNYSDEVIYSGLPSGKCIALNYKDGSLIWETSYSFSKGTSDIERANDSTSQPEIDKSFIYIVSSDGNIASLDKANGNQIWSRALSSFYGLTLFDDIIFITHNSGSIYAISKESSKVLWRNSDYINRDIKRTIFFKNNIIVVGDYEGYLHFINSENGITASRKKVLNTSIINYVADEDNIVLVDKEATIKMIKLEKFNIENDTSHQKDNSKKDVIENNNNENNSLIDQLIFWD